MPWRMSLLPSLASQSVGSSGAAASGAGGRETKSLHEHIRKSTLHSRQSKCGVSGQPANFFAQLLLRYKVRGASGHPCPYSTQV